MNIMLDTNAILDYIAVRQPWYQDIEQIWERVRSHVDRAYISASALTVTRNRQHLLHASIPVYTPADYLQLHQN